MCLILDTNKYGDFLKPENQDMEPIRNWIKTKNGKIVYSPTEKMERELKKHNEMRERFDRYRETQQLRLVPKNEVEQAMNSLQGLQSDDPDIIALALISRVSLLASADKNLHADFKKIVRGKIYQTSAHKRLLRNDLCP
jgi:hypothetical protein